MPGINCRPNLEQGMRQWSSVPMRLELHGDKQKDGAYALAHLSGYLRYFEVRGWPLRRPDFPLCVTVFATRQEFLAYSAAQVQQLPSSIVGSYFPRSNRCVLYNIEGITREGSLATNWTETEATIVHEAVHQLAYNTGIHQRLSMDPLWFVEGLASMFEQPQVYDLRQQQSTIESRMLPAKRQRLQPLLKQPDVMVRQLQSLIVADDLFNQKPDLAYDLGWALTFYLSERKPSEFRQYTTLLAARPFGDYTAFERSRDFSPSIWRRSESFRSPDHSPATAITHQELIVCAIGKACDPSVGHSNM